MKGAAIIHWDNANLVLRLVVITTVAVLLASFAARLGIYWAHADFFGGITGADFCLAALRGLRYDIAALALLVLPPLSLMLLPGQGGLLRWLRNTGYVLFAIAAAATALFGIASTQFFAFFYRHLGVEVKTVTSDFDFILQMALEQNLPALVAVSLGLAVVFWAGYRLVPKLPAPNYGFAAYGVRAVCILLLSYFFLWGPPGRQWVDQRHAFAKDDLRLGALVLNPAFAAFNNLFFPQSVAAALEGISPSAEAQALLNLVPESQSWSQPLLSNPSLSKAKPNIVLVVLESWTPDFIGAFGATASVTPNFDRIAAQGRRYQQAYASGPISIYGLQAILSGQPHLPSMPLMGFGGAETLPIKGVGELAADAGYTTLWAQAPRRASFNMDVLARRWGFQQIAGSEDYHTPDDWLKAPFGWDWPLYEYALNQFQQEAKHQPFFATLYTAVTHVPYVAVPAEHQVRPHNPDGVDGFINTLSRADWALGQFWQQAKQAAWHANTVYIFVSDHVVPKDMPDKSVRGCYRVPLLVLGPNIASADDHRVVSQIDILPTIKALLGAPLGTQNRSGVLSSDGAMSYWISPKTVLGHFRHKPVFAESQASSLAGSEHASALEADFIAAQRHYYQRHLRNNARKKAAR